MLVHSLKTDLQRRYSRQYDAKKRGCLCWVRHKYCRASLTLSSLYDWRAPNFSRKRDESLFVLMNAVWPRFIDRMPACAKYHYIARKNKIALSLILLKWCKPTESSTSARPEYVCEILFFLLFYNFGSWREVCTIAKNNDVFFVILVKWIRRQTVQFTLQSL
jgi:hypothetical protein